METQIEHLSCIVIRHRKENLRKCSLRGLEDRSDMAFFRYPSCVPKLPSFEGSILLDMEGEELSREDNGPIVVLDATWRYASTMMRHIPQLGQCQRRRIPQGWSTAYPRKQSDCLDPSRGLASIEAIYVAFMVMGRNLEGLLDSYYWKDLFLEKNNIP